jgi:hypothetical protein
LALQNPIFDNVLRFEDDSLRVLIFLEVLGRARKDFINLIQKIFCQTWEFKILKALLSHGPMNKSKLSLILFGTKGKHYKLSRKKEKFWLVFGILEQLILRVNVRIICVMTIQPRCAQV